MTDASLHDTWESGDSYDAYIGRWSRRVAPLFLEWLDTETNLNWLDIGCGTGALSHAIVKHCDPRAVIGIEPSDSFRKYARSLVSDPRILFKAGDASELPLDDNSSDVTVSALVLNFLPDRNKALAEMIRVTSPGGMVAFYVWDYAGGGLELLHTFWNAAASLNPAAEEFTVSNRFFWCNSSSLTKLARNSGLTDISIKVIETYSTFRNFDDYWRPFTLGSGPAPGYYKSLSYADREELQMRLQSMLTRNADGSIPMKARVWAVRGNV